MVTVIVSKKRLTACVFQRKRMSRPLERVVANSPDFEGARSAGYGAARKNLVHRDFNIYFRRFTRYPSTRIPEDVSTDGERTNACVSKCVRALRAILDAVRASVY